ncbi:MAG: hypothetical protein HRT52_10035 [Colwellia sp.]|nr:hypothetical protein [Colwellia sp.]
MPALLLSELFPSLVVHQLSYFPQLTTTFTAVKLNQMGYIPAANQGACFRTTEQFMIKASLFIHGYSLKNRDNDEHGLLRSPLWVGL